MCSKILQETLKQSDGFKWGQLSCLGLAEQFRKQNLLFECNSQLSNTSLDHQLSITDLDHVDFRLIKTASLRVRSQD